MLKVLLSSFFANASTFIVVAFMAFVEYLLLFEDIVDGEFIVWDGCFSFFDFLF